MIDRSEASRALAKVIAYDNCGNKDMKKAWLEALLFQLEGDDSDTQ